MREMKRTQEESTPQISQNPTKKIKSPVVVVPVEILRDVQFNMIDVKLFQKHILDKSDLILLKSYSSNDEMVEILFELLRDKSEEDHANFLSVIEEDYHWLRDKCEILLQKMRLDSLKNSDSNLSIPDQVSESVGTVNKPASENSSPDSIPLDTSSQHTCSINSDANDKCVIDNNLDKSSLDEKCPSKHLGMKLSQSVSSEMISIVRRNHRVVKGWTTLAHVLGMTSHVHRLRMRMMMDGEDVDACIIHLLQEWKGRYSKEATLEKLVSALREEGYNEVADELEEKFAN